MKKFNILLFFSLCYFFSQAQISFTRADMPSIGWNNPQQKDSIRNRVAASSFGNKGAHQIYNFTSLIETNPDTVFYLALTNPQRTAVPNANLSVFIPPTTYLFAVDTTLAYSYTGLQATVFNAVVISKYTNPDSIYKFPLVYGQTIKGNYGGSIKILASTVNAALGSFPFNWDSIKVAVTAGYRDTIDGWGIVKTPVGTYKCLRQKRVEYDTTTYYYNTSPGGSYTLMPTNIAGTQVLAANPAYSVTTSYSNLAKEAQGPVISFTYDSVSDPITADWTALPATLAANYGYTTGSAGLVTFSDSSTGPNALTYSWNFGDGSPTSSSANPNHTYSANGTYYVCETVSHGGSNSTFCDSVHVTNVVAGTPPVAQITPAGFDTICAGSSVVLRAQTGTNYTFRWSDANHTTTDSLVVTTAGSYTVMVHNLTDSTLSAATVVVVHTPSDSVTHAGLVLTSQNTESSYQWYQGNTLLTGDTLQTFTATQNGVYTLHYTDARGCSAVSNSVTITGVGINEISQSDFRIYPNPASELIQLDLSHVDRATLNELTEIVVYNLLGEKVKALPISQTIISVKDMSNGTYLIGVMDKNQSRKILGKFDVLK